MAHPFKRARRPFFFFATLKRKRGGGWCRGNLQKQGYTTRQDRTISHLGDFLIGELSCPNTPAQLHPAVETPTNP